MGLDSVELLMAIEDEFGIHIDDDDAANLTTPEETANYVYARVRKSENDPCLSQKGFYKLRKIIKEAFCIDRNTIKPETELKIILGKNIKSNWSLLKRAIGVKDFPRLKRSNVLFYGAVLIMPFIIIIPFLLNNTPLRLVLVIFVIISIFLNYATYNMGKIIPYKYKTVGSLIPYVECSKNLIWSKEMIIERIIEITSEKLGIPVEKINKNSLFVQDLGVD